MFPHLPTEIFLLLLFVFVSAEVITDYFKKLTIDMFCGLSPDEQVPALWNKLRRKAYSIAFTSSFYFAGIDIAANILQQELPMAHHNMTIYLFSIALAAYTVILTYAMQVIKVLYNQYLNN